MSDVSAPAAPQPAARPRGGLIRHPDFVKLWTAETVSQFGTQISALAIPLVAISLLGASAFEVALLGTIEFLPFVLISLPAGVWVDQMRRRPILIVGDLGRAAALASIPIAYLGGVLTIYQLYVVGFVVGVLTVFFDVAYQSYLPALVDRDQLVEGNAKLDISRSGAQLAGPGIGGVLVAALTAPIAIVADAISFLGSALFVLLIRRREPPPQPSMDAAGERTGMRLQVAEGLRFVLGNRYLRHIAACTATSNLFMNMAFATILVYVVRDLGLTPEAIGFTLGLGNVGVLLGAVAAGSVGRLLGVGRAIVLSAFLLGPGMLLIALAPREGAVPFLIAGIAVLGISNVVYNVQQVSLRQAITPGRMQGRMNATMRFIVWGTIPVGALSGGVLATVLGLREALIIGSIGGSLAFLPVLFSPVRTLRRIPDPEPGSHTEAEAPDGPRAGDEDLTGALADGAEGGSPPVRQPFVTSDEIRDPDR